MKICCLKHNIWSMLNKNWKYRNTLIVICSIAYWHQKSCSSLDPKLLWIITAFKINVEHEWIFRNCTLPCRIIVIGAHIDITWRFRFFFILVWNARQASNMSTSLHQALSNTAFHRPILHLKDTNERCIHRP